MNYVDNYVLGRSRLYSRALPRATTSIPIVDAIFLRRRATARVAGDDGASQDDSEIEDVATNDAPRTPWRAPTPFSLREYADDHV